MTAADVQSPFRRFTRLLIVSSVLMILLGLIAVTLPMAAGIGLSIVLGWLIVFTGIVHLVYAFAAQGAGAVLWRLLLGVFYLVGGMYLAIHPALSLITLTLLLAALLLFEGAMALSVFFTLRKVPGSGWLLFDSIVTLLLSFLIWRGWPLNATWVVGTLFGLNLILSGSTRLFSTLAARRAVAVV